MGTPPANDEWIDITEVARLTRKKYSKARDMMLQGKYGETKREGRTLLVRREKVLIEKETV